MPTSAPLCLRYKLTGRFWEKKKLFRILELKKIYEY